MNAIVPLNITAIRVNNNDESNIVNQFKGRTAVFDQLPYTSSSTETSTGDNIVRPLNTQSSPGISLGTGVHVHWLLPDYFRKGAQQTTGEIVFPAAPNRWLVTRWLSIWNASTSSYGSPTAQTFMVESDFISGTRQADPWGVVRPAIAVPLPAVPVAGQQPYRYMGRVLDFNSWNPSGEQLNNYLPAQTGADGQPLYLTSIGFVGPSFASYYPECNGVFGFWDHFKDQTTIYNAINNNQPIQFKVSYQVTGWINETNKDPLTNLTQTITNIYNNYVADCNSQNVEITQTPGDVFLQYMSANFGWAFPANDVSWTLKSDQTINTLTIPQSTLCSGIMQEIVWNMETNTNSYFLNNPNSAEQPSGVWTDTVEIAIGNTMTEALSALMKYDLGENLSDEVLNNYEYLLDALQLGLLNDLENQNSKLINLQESLHSAAFSKQGGGLLWIINQQSSGIATPQNPDQQITLPLILAEQLNQLNIAQKNYDQGREKLSRFRRQLFMDWLHYVKLFVNPKLKDFVTANQVMAFLSSSNAGELNSVVAMGNDTGILNYTTDPVSSAIISPQQPSGSTTSLAYAVWNAFQTVQTALAEYTDWVMGSAPAPPFWQATDPVLLLEGNLIVPPRRNGGDSDLFVRTSLDILNKMEVTYNSATFNINISQLPGIPAINPNTPQVQDVTQLTLEAYVLVPSMAVLVGNWLQAVGGGSNPAVENLSAFILSLQNAQGGLSPLESATTAGLYAAINVSGYVAVINPQQSVSTPQAITITFTNIASTAWLASPVAWDTQTALSDFSSTRVDPFLPVSMVWNVTYWPLKPNVNNTNYNASNITDYFALDPNGIDYQYIMNNGVPVNFTSQFSGNYNDWVTMSSKAVFNLTQQINNYIKNYPPNPNNPDDPNNAVDQSLENALTVYQNKNYLAQSISSFSTEQTLSAYIAQMGVVNLVSGGRDQTTVQISDAAIQNPQDNWYNYGFNSVSPVATGPLAQHNFTPLRGGFMEVNSVTIVDVFGQTMVLSTAQQNVDGSMQVICAQSMQPQKEDTVNAQKVYLAPRVLAPTRLWFRWLSASYNTSVPGITSDFIEMNSHPATSPITGWIMPNHLDNLLFFYDSPGTPIGSFGIEHNALVYRTQPGNLSNPQDILSQDIGPQGSPTVNPGVANFMWYINGKSVAFFNDLMSSILGSDAFINPASFAQDASLAVLIGRPLALARAVAGIETAGNVLPVSQADTAATDPFPQDIINNRYEYSERQASSTAQLSTVQFPLRLGDLANIDDGLVGYIIEDGNGNLGSTFWSPAAPNGAQNGVEHPSATNIQLTLNNTEPEVFTILLDPRAAVHATTGILPVDELGVPPDQYSETLSSLSTTFFTHPVLQQQTGLVIPLPQESNYSWSWINPGTEGSVNVPANAGNEFAVYGYSQQTLIEGWTQLQVLLKQLQ